MIFPLHSAFRARVFFTVLTLALPFATYADDQTVHITSEGPTPNEIAIDAGDTITFVNDDTAPHWIASDIHPTHSLYPGSDIRKCNTEESVDVFDSCRSLANGESYQFTFSHAGTWSFHDHLNPTITGIVTVGGASERADIGRQELSSMSKAHAWFLSKYYTAFPKAGKRKLESLNMINVTRNDIDLEFWMRVFGYAKIYDALDADAKKPAKRPADAGSQALIGMCHTEAHFAGRMAYKLYGLPMLTENVLDTRCGFGFYHGMVEMSLGGIGSDAIVEDFAEKCEQYADDPIRRAFCTHAIGHGLMVHYSFNLPAAIRKCQELISSVAGRRMCYHGAYMENAFAVVGLGISEHVTEWQDPKRPDFPCTAEELDAIPYAREMCYADQSMIWWLQLKKVDEKAAIQGCLRAPATAREMCFTGMGFNMAFAMGDYTLSDSSIIKKCTAAPTKDDRVNCLSGAMFMRSTHWWSFEGFRLPSFCTALGFDNLDACNEFIVERFSWLKES